MRSRWRLVALVLAAALVIWLAVGIILAGQEPVPPPGGNMITLPRGGKVVGNRISSRSWSFDYEKAQMSPDGSVATVLGVKNGVLYKNGKPYLKISAKQITVNTQSFDFSALGTVHIESISKDNGTRTFETDMVQWTNATKILVLAHPCLVRTGDQILKVANATVNFSTNEVRLGEVEGGFEVPEH